MAGSGTGHEPWYIVQGVQTILETVHTTTGLPWWATLMVQELRQLGTNVEYVDVSLFVCQLSGVTLRAVIFPFYVYQIQATQRSSFPICRQWCPIVLIVFLALGALKVDAS